MVSLLPAHRSGWDQFSGSLDVPFCAFHRGPAFIESGDLRMKERDLVLDVFYGVL
jgi:hypothetical protein